MFLYNIIARITCNATVNWEHIDAGTTYVVWREERLWNVGVLQRIRLSIIVCLFSVSRQIQQRCVKYMPFLCSPFLCSTNF